MSPLDAYLNKIICGDCREIVPQIPRDPEHHPDDPGKSNIDRIRAEMEDVNNSMAKLDSLLAKIQCELYNRKS